MRPRGRLLAATAIWIAAALLPLSAAAQTGEDRESSTSTSRISAEPSAGDGTVTVPLTGQTSLSSVTGPGLPEWLRKCTWDVYTRFEVDAYYSQYTGGNPAYEDYEPAGLDPDEEFNIIFCSPGPEASGVTPGIIISGVLDYFPVGGTPPQIILDWLVARSVASVEIPVQFGQAAPIGDVDAPMITQLPTWLWIEDDLWQPVSVTPSPVFGVTATATATPFRVDFFGEDGEHVNCGNNTGPAYNFDLTEEQQHSDCTLTYNNSSAVGDYTLTSTIYWQVDWACSAYCGSGTLANPMSITTTRDVRVAELQAVITSTGSS